MVGHGWYKPHLSIMGLHELLWFSTQSRDLQGGGYGSLWAHSGILQGVTVPSMNFPTEMCLSMFLFLIGLYQLQK